MLIDEFDREVQAAAVSHTNVHVTLLKRLAYHDSELIREAVARNPSAPNETLKELATDTYSVVRKAVAQNPQTTVECLQALARDPNWLVRQTVAANPNISTELVEQLAKDNDEHLRIAVTQNPNCPVGVLTTLATDLKINIRYNVANHPNCPVEVLYALCSDDVKYVRSSAAIGVLNQYTKTAAIPNDIQLYRMLLNHAPIYAGACVAFDDRISDDLRWDLIKTRKNHPLLAFVALQKELPNHVIQHLIQASNPTINSLLSARNDLTKTQEVVAWL
jgi:hypothetical protein